VLVANQLTTPQGQGRSQEFANEGTNQGVWGTEVPQRGPGAEPRWGLGAKPPEAGDKCGWEKQTTNMRQWKLVPYVVLETKKSAKKYRLHQWMWTTDALTTDSGKWLDVGTCI